MVSSDEEQGLSTQSPTNVAGRPPEAREDIALTQQHMVNEDHHVSDRTNVENIDNPDTENQVSLLSHHEDDPPSPPDGGGGGGCCPCVQKLEGPDAWVTVLASSIIMYCISSEMSSFGVYYVEYTDYFGASKSAVGWIKGVQTISGAAFSVFGGVLIKLYGCRSVALCAGFSMFLGFFLASFSPHMAMTYLTHGTLVGIGVPVATMCSMISIQQHFTRNRVLGTGIAYLGFTLGGFTGPLFSTSFIETYGLRGALLLHSAIVAHIVPFGLMLRRPRGLPQPSRDSPGDVAAPRRRQFVRELFDFSLFKKPTFVCVILVAVCAFYNISTFMAHLPGRAVHYGVSITKAAYLQSINAIAGGAMRVPCMFLANAKAVNKVLVYEAAMVLLTLGSFVYTTTYTYGMMTVAPLVFGFGVGFFTTVMHTTYSYLFGVERLPKVLGLFNIFTYIGLALGPPISGLIYDRTHDYELPFYVSGAVSLVACILVAVIYFLDRRERQNKQVTEKPDIS